LFKSKQRIASAWAKGLMFGKAVGARDERDRILEIIDNWQPPVNAGTYTVDGAKNALVVAIKGKLSD
jgi:hypothetical protein